MQWYLQLVMYSVEVPEISKYTARETGGKEGGMHSISSPVAVGTPTIMFEFCYQPDVLFALLTILPTS